MKYTLFSTTLLSAAILASATQAEPRWPNWYVGVHGSIPFVTDSSVRGNPLADDLEYDSGYGYGASLGYRPEVEGGLLRNMRIEAEWHKQQSDIDKVQNPLGASLNGNGDVSVNAYMLNVFFDATFRDDDLRQAFTPYFGGGVGFANIELDDTQASLGAGGDEDDVLAFQAMAGISYAPEFMPHTEWTLGYRYFTTQDAEFSYVSGGSYKVEYDSHNVEAGVRFLF